MGVIERRAREKAALRQEILDAARDLILKEGYESVSMRKIAEKIEYSPTTIYLYFQDKSELITEICNQTFALLTRKLEEVEASIADPVERLKAGLRAYVEFGLEHPDQYRVTLMTPHDVECHNQDIQESEGGRAFQHMVEAVAACVGAGRFQEADVMAVSQALWTFVHGFVSAQIIHAEGFPWVERERLLTLAIDVAVRGLTK